MSRMRTHYFLRLWIEAVVFPAYGTLEHGGGDSAQLLQGLGLFLAHAGHLQRLADLLKVVRALDTLRALDGRVDGLARRTLGAGEELREQPGRQRDDDDPDDQDLYQGESASQVRTRSESHGDLLLVWSARRRF